MSKPTGPGWPDHSCAFPVYTGIPEWPCSKAATHIIVGLSGSGFYPTRMPRCDAHLAATISAMNPPGTEYPHYVLGWVEPTTEKDRLRNRDV